MKQPSALCLADFEKEAGEILSESVWSWVSGSSGSEEALRDNRDAFQDWFILPRQLVSAGAGHTRLNLLDQLLPAPILLAPIGLQRLVHADGELATAQAAGAMDIPMLVSALTTRDLSEIYAAHGGTCGVQLYLQDSRTANSRLLAAAEDAGYPWLVVTVDVPVNGLRYRELRSGFSVPPEMRPIYAEPNPVPLDIGPGDSRVFQGAMSRAPCWDDVERLRTRWKHKLVLKGLLHPDDALRARDAGVDAVIVSNHGGRALSVAPSPLRVLQGIRSCLGNGFPVLVDGGIRSGADVFIALALGADAVLIGRPQLHALAADGARGVARMLRMLRDELELTMALAGCPTLDTVNSACVLPRRTNHPSIIRRDQPST